CQLPELALNKPPSTVSPFGGGAKRLIILIADGLRADIAFGPAWMPVLNTIKPKTAFGIAHTWLFTTTQPGIRAIVAGSRTTALPELPGIPGKKTDSFDSVLK